MDARLAVADRLEGGVSFSTANLAKLDVDALFLDTTSTHFEIVEEDGEGEGIRGRAHPKEHRTGFVRHASRRPTQVKPIAGCTAYR
ncbi:hypothetical protein [Caldinitratiruptor microaerophilus]|nr:hypothetical protein [Caldinitratiruptor microaerophilus]